VLDQFENRVSVVLCHAKVCRASGGNNDNVPGHSERREESQFIICGAAAKPTSQRCLKAWPHASHFVEALPSSKNKLTHMAYDLMELRDS
jgi:hypothetical protein